MEPNLSGLEYDAFISQQCALTKCSVNSKDIWMPKSFDILTQYWTCLVRFYGAHWSPFNLNPKFSFASQFLWKIKALFLVNLFVLIFRLSDTGSILVLMLLTVIAFPFSLKHYSTLLLLTKVLTSVFFPCLVSIHRCSSTIISVNLLSARNNTMAESLTIPTNISAGPCSEMSVLGPSRPALPMCPFITGSHYLPPSLSLHGLMCLPQSLFPLHPIYPVSDHILFLMAPKYLSSSTVLWYSTVQHCTAPTPNSFPTAPLLLAYIYNAANAPALKQVRKTK